MLSINISELVWGIVNFFLLYFLLKRFLYKPLISFMDERERRIRRGLDDEKAALEEQQHRQAELEALCQSNRQQGEELIRQAKYEAERQRAVLIVRAEEEAAAMQLRFSEEESAFREEKRGELCKYKAELSERLANKILQG